MGTSDYFHLPAAPRYHRNSPPYLASHGKRSRPRRLNRPKSSSGQPQITVVARDRGGSYAIATAKALPEATQVADRWHLMENASRAFLDAVRKSMRKI